jgi:hypothetical protein
MLSDDPPDMLPKDAYELLERVLKEMQDSKSKVLQATAREIFDIEWPDYYRATVQLNPPLFRVTLYDRGMRDLYADQYDSGSDIFSWGDMTFNDHDRGGNVCTLKKLDHDTVRDITTGIYVLNSIRDRRERENRAKKTRS